MSTHTNFALFRSSFSTLDRRNYVSPRSFERKCDELVGPRGLTDVIADNFQTIDRSRREFPRRDVRHFERIIIARIQIFSLQSIVIVKSFRVFLTPHYFTFDRD